MKKIILIASLLMAGGLWAEGICVVTTPLISSIEEKCDKGDVLLFRFNDKDWNGAFMRDTLIANFCDFGKEIEVLTYSTTPMSIPDGSVNHSAWCIYSGKPRGQFKNSKK